MLAGTTTSTAAAATTAAAAAAGWYTANTSEDDSRTISIIAVVATSSTSGASGGASDLMMRRTKRSELDDSRRPVKAVLLGWPFTDAQQPWFAPIRIPFERAVQLVVALDAVLRCGPSTEAVDTALEEPRLTLRSGQELRHGYNGCGGCGGGGGGGGSGRGSNSLELEAMKEVMHVLWPGVGPSMSSSLPPPYADDEVFFMARWVLLHLKGCSGEPDGCDRDRASLGCALVRQVLAGSTYSSSPSLFLSSSPSENDVAPPERHGKITTTTIAAQNSADQTTPTTTSSGGAVASYSAGGQSSYFFFRALGRGTSTVLFGGAYSIGRHPLAAMSLKDEEQEEEEEGEDDAETSHGNWIRAGSITVGIFGTPEERRQRVPSPGADKLPLLPPPPPPPPPPRRPLCEAPAESRVAAVALTRLQKYRSDAGPPRLVAHPAIARQPSKVSCSSEGRKELGQWRNDRGVRRDAPGDTQVASPATKCPSAAVSIVERETTVACANLPTVSHAGHPRAEASGPLGLRVDTSWRKTPVAFSTSLRGTTVAATVAAADTDANTNTVAAATGRTSSFSPASHSHQTMAHTAGRQMGAQEGAAARQERWWEETPSPPPQRGRPLRPCTPPSSSSSRSGIRPDHLSPPLAGPRPSSESAEDASCTTPTSPSAKEGLVAACVSPSSFSSPRRGRCRSPSSPRGRPASPSCGRCRSRPPSPRLARPGSTSPSTRRRTAAVCSPVAVTNCSFPKAEKTEDDQDGSTATVTPPLTPLEVTPPGSRARSSGVSPASRSPPPSAGSVESTTYARSSKPLGFFKDDDEPTKATITTAATTTAEGVSGVASTTLSPVPHAKQRSCGNKIGFYGILSRNARGRSDSGGGGGGGDNGGSFCNNGGACGDSFRQTVVGTNSSINKEPLKKGRAASEAFPANLEQKPDKAAADVAAGASAATDATTAINTILAAAAASTTTTTTTTIDFTIAATATAAYDGGRAARRVSWSPLVLARDEAATAIKYFISRLRKSEVIKRRVAHEQAAARLFLVKRRAEREREQEAGRGRPAMSRRRPVAQRGGFFRLLWSLERSDLRGYRLWSDPEPFIAFGTTDCSQPVRWALGDYVRRMATDLLNRGQART